MSKGIEPMKCKICGEHPYVEIVYKRRCSVWHVHTNHVGVATHAIRVTMSSRSSAISSWNKLNGNGKLPK